MNKAPNQNIWKLLSRNASKSELLNYIPISGVNFSTKS